MRLVHYFPRVRSEYGGPMRAVVDLCGQLAARGHETVLLTRDDSEVPASWRNGRISAPRVQVLPRAGNANWMSREALGHARKQLRDAEAFHVHGVWEVDNLRLCAVARRLGVPYFVSARGMLDDWSMAQKPLKKRVFLGLAGRTWLERAQAVHLTAEDELKQARRWFPNGRGTVIPNLLDLSPYEVLVADELARAEFGLPDRSRPVLLALSRLHYKKGFEVLFRAVRLLCDDGLECTLVVAGSGEPSYVAALHDLVQDLGLAETIRFVGHVTGELKASLYRAADLFVLPTSQENFGFVFVESLASATPVITTHGVDIWRELESSGGALIVDQEPRTLARTIGLLLQTGDRLRSMGEAGRSWVFRELQPERVVEQFEEMYRTRMTDL